MEDDMLPASAGGGYRHNGWQVGQAVALRTGLLAGRSGALVSCAADGRWIVRLVGLRAGVLLVVTAAELQHLPESAGGSCCGTDTTLPPHA
jgi:hypothetical protein